MESYDIITEFENTIAKYTGSKYGVATDSCVHAIFLSLLYLKEIGEIHEGDSITVPKQTFRSVPNYIRHAGLRPYGVDMKWTSCYPLWPTRIYDSALLFDKDIYIEDTFFCLSFQYRKTLPIGRGGMILTDDENAVKRLKELRLNGKDGWNMYMMPEQAARGLTLFEMREKKSGYKDYPDWTEGVF
jgi:dTDP-4-amino-4,6-dideoxygalactose transaminase